MKGFFTPQETASVSRPNGKILSCISCGAYQACHSPKQEVQGKGKKGIMIIGEAPTSIDDVKGTLFQSQSAKFLKNTLDDLNIDLYEDCYLTNAIKCYLPTKEANRKPSNYEIDCCRHFVMKAIKTYKPKMVLLLGNSALQSVIGGRWKRDLGAIDKWRGWTIPDQELKCWICPTYSHSYIDSIYKRRPEALTIWKIDLKRALSKLKDNFPLYEEPEIEYLDENQLDALNTIKDDFSFDYETTGLKPQADGHHIVCASVADSWGHVYTFMMPKSRKARKPFLDLLANPKLGKIAQNMKFEDAWTNVILKSSVINWVWDTMLATHILDNRSGVTSLKFQTYVQFGIIDYESEVSSYLKSNNEGNANAINNIQTLVEKVGGQKLLLKYCALDSLYEYRLAMIQKMLIELPF